MKADGDSTCCPVCRRPQYQTPTITATGQASPIEAADGQTLDLGFDTYTEENWAYNVI